METLSKRGPCVCGSGKRLKNCCLKNRRPSGGVLRLAFKGSDLDKENGQDPLITRIFWQILKIRDHVYRNKEEALAFDKKHGPVFQNLLEAKVAKQRCIDLMRDHRLRVRRRETASYDPKGDGVIHIREAVDMELNMAFKDFFIRGNIALKALVKLTGYLGYNMSFAFTDEKKYQSKKDKFLKAHPEKEFVEYVALLEQDRKNWYSLFIEIRNAIEHDGFELPNINYLLGEDDEIKTFYPTINNQDLQDILEKCWQNIFSLTEEMIVFLMKHKIQEPFTILHVPEARRSEKMPFKYVIGMRR